MYDFLQAVLDGILFGTTYSLIGIGFTLVFGVMHKINMSYAAVSIAAAYAGLLAGGLIRARAPGWYSVARSRSAACSATWCT
jgi:branched-subunit amino acid ABC-type transport system permease component